MNCSDKIRNLFLNYNKYNIYSRFRFEISDKKAALISIVCCLVKMYSKKNPNINCFDILNKVFETIASEQDAKCVEPYKYTDEEKLEVLKLAFICQEHYNTCRTYNTFGYTKVSDLFKTLKDLVEEIL